MMSEMDRWSRFFFLLNTCFGGLAWCAASARQKLACHSFSRTMIDEVDNDLDDSSGLGRWAGRP